MELKLEQVPIGITVTVAKINGKIWKRLKMKEKAKKKKYKKNPTTIYKLPNTLTTHTHKYKYECGKNVERSIRSQVSSLHVCYIIIKKSCEVLVFQFVM